MSIFEERKHYKPFIYGDIVKPLIEAMWKGHWTNLEFDFKSDKQDYYTKLNSEEQELIKRAILMVSQVEVAVKSYWSNIGKLLPHPEIGDMGGVFGGIEVIHSWAYSEILAQLGFEDEFEKMLKEPIIKGRVDYLSKYVNKIYKNDRKNIVYSLILFTIFIENISLFSQFYTILGFNRYKNVLKDVGNIVAYTSKEEALHAEGGMALIRQIRIEHPELFDQELEDKIYQEVQEAVKAEGEIIKWILQGYSNEFVSEEILNNFLKDRLNTSLTQIGYQKQFETDPELLKVSAFMREELYAPTLTDFFHQRPIDYQKKSQKFSDETLF